MSNHELVTGLLRVLRTGAGMMALLAVLALLGILAGALVGQP